MRSGRTRRTGGVYVDLIGSEHPPEGDERLLPLYGWWTLAKGSALEMGTSIGGSMGRWAKEQGEGGGLGRGVRVRSKGGIGWATYELRSVENVFATMGCRTREMSAGV